MTNKQNTKNKPKFPKSTNPHEEEQHMKRARELAEYAMKYYNTSNPETISKNDNNK